VASNCFSDNCAVIFVSRLQDVRSQNSVEITCCEKSQIINFLDIRFVFYEERKNDVVLAWIATEDLGTLEVGLLGGDET